MFQSNLEVLYYGVRNYSQPSVSMPAGFYFRRAINFHKVNGTPPLDNITYRERLGMQVGKSVSRKKLVIYLDGAIESFVLNSEGAIKEALTLLAKSWDKKYHQDLQESDGIEIVVHNPKLAAMYSRYFRKTVAQIQGKEITPDPEPEQVTEAEFSYLYSEN